MILLGRAVWSSSTPLDDWFHGFGHTPVRILAIFASPLLLLAIWLAVVGSGFVSAVVAVRVRRPAVPPAAYVLVQLIKPLFGRYEDGFFAYPSGHITLTTVVLGLCVLMAGGALWAVLIAVGYIALAMVGVGATFHYFTDTVGGVLLGTSIVCIAALVARRDLTRVNPTAIYVTRDR